MEMTRRGFIGHLTGGGVLLASAGALEMSMFTCNPPTVSGILTEVDNILTFIAPLGDGAAAIIEIADPAIAPIVSAAVAVYDKAIPTIEQYLADWSAAAASAQPGILAQIEAAIQALQADVKSILNSVTGVSGVVLAEINSIVGAIIGEISALLKDILQLQAAGGTSAALRGMVTQPHKLYRLAGPDTNTRRNNLAAELSVATNTNIDPARSALAVKLRAIQFK
jgi:hypothetical protein